MNKRNFTRIAAAFAVLLFAAAGLRAQTNNPAADPRAVVISGQSRFTVLTPQLIRMEWSADSHFEDHASLVFINRRMPVPSFSTRDDSGWLVLRTQKLMLRYKKNTGEFTPENLFVEFDLNGVQKAWRPGMEDKANLEGTIRTLDGVKGSTPLGTGLLSRDGWVLIDDTTRPLFDDSDWPWAMPRPPGQRQDFTYSLMGMTTEWRWATTRASPEKFPCRRVLLSARGGRATGLIRIKNLRISCASSARTTSRSTCSSLTWIGTPRLA